MKYNPRIHHRRSIRLKGYDYSRAGLYFITLCCRDRKHLFGKIENGKLSLNVWGKIAEEEWLNTEKIRDNILLHEFIVMPNHFHAIIEILESASNTSTGELHSPEKGESPLTQRSELHSAPNDQSHSPLNIEPYFSTNKFTSKAEFKSPSQTIGAIIRGYKGATTKKIKELIFSGFSRAGEGDSGKVTGELQFAPTAPTAPTGIDLSKSIWQRNYYENIIRNERAYRNISQYIINNPKKWTGDKFYLK